MEMIPRITRAQSMDALSSQSNIAGYKAVLLAAADAAEVLSDAHDRRRNDSAGEGARAGRRRRRAAGDRDGAPARRRRQRLRRARRRQRTVQSLGATFLEFDLGGDAEGAGGYAKELTPEQQERQRAWMVEQIGANDVVITTALVPGRKAPVLITKRPSPR